MRLKSLKVKIAITLALILFAAIGLTNFVLMRIVENNIIESQLKSGVKWIIAIHETFFPLENTLLTASEHGDAFFPGIVFAMFNGKDKSQAFFTPMSYHSAASSSGDIVLLATEIIEQIQKSGRTEYLLAGSEWGVFWLRSKYLVTGTPLPGNAGAGVVVVELGAGYRMLRNAQQVSLGYLFLNFLVLLVAGGYRLSCLISRPIHKFVSITDNYRYSDSHALFPEKQNDEFNRLSTSLNRMIRRIEDDREDLESSIKTIEKTNQELEKAQQEIIRAEKLASIGRLSAGIAHEIGNPVGIVLGYLGLIKKSAISPDDARAIDYIERAEAEISRINMVIRQLLDFSRPAPAACTVFPMHELLHDAVQMLSQQPLMDKTRIVSDFFAPNDVVCADYNQLHQVIVNLILNAADAISACGEVECGEIRLATGISDDGESFVLEVVNNGEGIPPESVDKIFDPFYTTRETGKGTGLGLYVSYMIIKSFGGNISIGEPVEQGSRMIVHLPLKAGKPERTQ